VAHTRTRQRFSVGRTQRTATDNQYSRGKQPSLPFFANSTEENLSAVTIVHRVQYSSEQLRVAREGMALSPASRASSQFFEAYLGRKPQDPGQRKR